MRPYCLPTLPTSARQMTNRYFDPGVPSWRRLSRRSPCSPLLPLREYQPIPMPRPPRVARRQWRQTALQAPRLRRNQRSLRRKPTRQQKRNLRPAKPVLPRKNIVQCMRATLSRPLMAGAFESVEVGRGGILLYSRGPPLRFWEEWVLDYSNHPDPVRAVRRLV